MKRPDVLDDTDTEEAVATADSAGQDPAAEPDPRDTGLFDTPRRTPPRGIGLEAGGQAGDTMGLSRDEIAGPESVEELIEEGQAYEAAAISGVEDAPDADQGEVKTRQVPEDDVPDEYLDDGRPDTE
ncbi:MAG TPA: hypothetical protein VOA80_23680 [Thermoanaerobaculia bacterium]|nr:hypothetical protein [Thermoanaerobaculia bacterium]